VDLACMLRSKCWDAQVNFGLQPLPLDRCFQHEKAL
jgi:hypothetical protein